MRTHLPILAVIAILVGACTEANGSPTPPTLSSEVAATPRPAASAAAAVATPAAAPTPTPDPQVAIRTHIASSVSELLSLTDANDIGDWFSRESEWATGTPAFKDIDYNFAILEGLLAKEDGSDLTEAVAKIVAAADALGAEYTGEAPVPDTAHHPGDVVRVTSSGEDYADIVVSKVKTVKKYHDKYFSDTAKKGNVYIQAY
jgi:hypothetical protein